MAVPSPAAPQPLRVALVCSGLDHARRGFESFARECFVALRDEPGLDLRLIKGSGPTGDREHSVPTLTRDSVPLRALGRVFAKQPFRFEQLEFAFSLQPELFRRQPHIVYFSEWHTGLALAALRRATRRRYHLVLCNGTMAEAGFGHIDRVQELTPAALDTVLARGADPARHTLLPYGFSISPEVDQLPGDAKSSLRLRLHLPVGRQIILSVAALNCHHKRMDYLVREIAQLPEPRPFLLMVGEAEAETPRIRSLAHSLLGEEGYSTRAVDHTDMDDVYRASDLFVLASLGESFGRVLVEAMAHGLPCLAHDYPTTRFVVGDQGSLADLSRAGALADLVRRVNRLEPNGGHARARHRFVLERFSWERLRPRYVEMLRGVSLAAAR